MILCSSCGLMLRLFIFHMPVTDLGKLVKFIFPVVICLQYEKKVYFVDILQEKFCVQTHEAFQSVCMTKAMLQHLNTRV